MTQPKHRLFQEFARVGAALSHASRLELLDMLAQGEKSVESLAARTGLSIKNTSAHLRVLRGAALVASRREGTSVIYRLADASVSDLLRLLQQVARRQLSEVRELAARYFSAPEGFAPVNADELAQRLEAGDVTLIDVRPRDEYEQGHIVGALSVPLDHLEQHLALLPPSGEVIAYCRGEYCLLSLEAAERLRRHGIQARTFAGSVSAWASTGGSVATHSPLTNSPK